MKQLLSIHNKKLALFLVLLISVLIRLPDIYSGLPFFYVEDEAHHFNRTVNMVKTGTYDPDYFHKPSLHFYLRMPVVATSFLWSVAKGEIKTLEEIRTSDQFGIGDYAFTASHPRLVVWNRFFSVIFALIAISITFKIIFSYTQSLFAATTGALLAAIAPGYIEHGTVIGVDSPMTMLCMLSSYFAVKLLKKFDQFGLIVISILSGLAVSTKYNALPIVVLPILVVALSNKISRSTLSIAIFLPILGFLLGSPFILSNLPKFLNQFAYEIWHYGVEGHAGHMDNPGLPQVWHYLAWLNESGIGVCALVLSILGAIILVRSNWNDALTLLAFPLLFFILMCLQKTNFERNVIVLIPYLAILAGMGLFFLIKLLNLKSKQTIYLLPVLFLCCLLQPTLAALNSITAKLLLTDSRKQCFDWVNNTNLSGDIAIDGTLQMPIFLEAINGKTRLTTKGVSRFDPAKTDFLDLYQLGYKNLIISSKLAVPSELKNNLKLIKIFPGVKESQRIVKNPRISIYNFQDEIKISEKLINYNKVLKLPLIVNGDQTVKCENLKKEACWVNNNLTQINFVNSDNIINKKLNLVFATSTPWENQVVRFFDFNNWSHAFKIEPNIDQEITLNLEPGQLKNKMFIEVSVIHAPNTQGLNADSRRLGIQIK